MIEVPEGWEIKPFSSLASINMGQSPESEFVNENQEGIAFLQGNADFGDINPKGLYWVKVPKKLAKKDDILISVRAPVGDINMADKEYCIGRGLSALTIKKINQKFGFYALFQERIQLDRLAQGSTFLAIGKNDIKIFCTNSMGQTSLQQKLEINSRYTTTTKPKTWFVGIGVSNYKNTSMNLRYAAKDIRDLVGTFANKNDTTITYSIDTLIDNNATLSNILAIKQKLLQANINDKVIIAVTGHGLLNKDLDFYYATYDVDFDNPEKNGLKYEQLEFLLDGVGAQNKLLLIDACHSGALDKEEILASKQKIFVKSEGKDTGSISTDARSTIKIKKSKVSLNNTLELMQNMFADVSNSNGAVVISAAGGLEYAFESPQWNNGVFTYCVRKGIEELAADDDPESGNYDFDVSVQELMKYVSKKVSELTNGKQRPTSRRENLEFDWILKYYKR